MKNLEKKTSVIYILYVQCVQNFWASSTYYLHRNTPVISYQSYIKPGVKLWQYLNSDPVLFSLSRASMTFAYSLNLVGINTLSTEYSCSSSSVSAACIDLRPELDVVSTEVCKYELLSLFESKMPWGNAFIKKKNEGLIMILLNYVFSLYISNSYFQLWHTDVFSIGASVNKPTPACSSSKACFYDNNS